MTARLDFQSIGQAALAEAERLLAEWLPHGKREGQEWVSLNPTRDDSRPGSFKINLSTGKWSDFATGDKGGDLISLYAYLNDLKNGKAARLLSEQLGIHKTEPPRGAKEALARAKWKPLRPVPPDAPEPPAAHRKYGPPSVIWTYRNEGGAVLFHVYRFDLQQPKKKEIRPLSFCVCTRGDLRTPVGTRAWRWQGLPAPRPLYHLDKLAARPHDAVIVTEGEKAADAATLLFPQCVATTSANGAKAPDQSDWTPLSGRTVWIWHDHDEPGREYAASVAKLLKAIAAEVKIFRIDGEHPDGWDAAEALAEGWTAEPTDVTLDDAAWDDKAHTEAGRLVYYESRKRVWRLVAQSSAADILAGELDFLFYDAIVEGWYRYGDHYWQKVEGTNALAPIDEAIRRKVYVPAGTEVGYSAPYLRGVETLLRTQGSSAQAQSTTPTCCRLETAF